MPSSKSAGALASSASQPNLSTVSDLPPFLNSVVSIKLMALNRLIVDESESRLHSQSSVTNDSSSNLFSQENAMNFVSSLMKSTPASPTSKKSSLPLRRTVTPKYARKPLLKDAKMELVDQGGLRILRSSGSSYFAAPEDKYVWYRSELGGAAGKRANFAERRLLTAEQIEKFYVFDRDPNLIVLCVRIQHVMSPHSATTSTKKDKSKSKPNKKRLQQQNSAGSPAANTDVNSLYHSTSANQNNSTTSLNTMEVVLHHNNSIDAENNASRTGSENISNSTSTLEERFFIAIQLDNGFHLERVCEHLEKKMTRLHNNPTTDANLSHLNYATVLPVNVRKNSELVSEQNQALSSPTVEQNVSLTRVILDESDLQPQIANPIDLPTTPVMSTRNQSADRREISKSQPDLMHDSSDWSTHPVVNVDSGNVFHQLLHHPMCPNQTMTTPAEPIVAGGFEGAASDWNVSAVREDSREWSHTQQQNQQQHHHQRHHQLEKQMETIDDSEWNHRMDLMMMSGEQQPQKQKQQQVEGDLWEEDVKFIAFDPHRGGNVLDPNGSIFMYTASQIAPTRRRYKMSSLPRDGAEQTRFRLQQHRQQYAKQQQHQYAF